LFFKIFVSFWATAIGTAIVLAITFRLGPGATPSRWHLAWFGALLLSGAVCYLLTRYLTGPVLRLRTAARRLAAGDLHSRVSESTSRHDEIGDLVRDFNVMASRIEQLVTNQRQLLSDISHELRSPLTRFNATLGVARQRLGDHAIFDRMERDTERLNEMIGRVLTLARLETTSTAPPTDRSDLRSLVSDVVTNTQSEAHEHNCRIELSTTGDCHANVNPDLLRSAIENVIRNSIRYTAPNTVIEVRLEQHLTSTGEMATICVSDNGPGVPASELANIFRPFYRVDDARDRLSGGVGLGLAIADRVARLHGGSIQAMNRARGGLVVELNVKAECTREELPSSDLGSLAKD